MSFSRDSSHAGCFSEKKLGTWSNPLFIGCLFLLITVLAGCGQSVDLQLQEDIETPYVVLFRPYGDNGSLGDFTALSGSLIGGRIQLTVEPANRLERLHYFLDESPEPLPASDSNPHAVVLDTKTLATGLHSISVHVTVARDDSTRLAYSWFSVFNEPGGQPPSDPEPIEPPDPPTPSPPDSTPPVEEHIPSEAVWILVGQDAQSIVAAHNPGTTFAFEAGVHRLNEPIVPRDHDSFIGEVGAVISGARILSDFQRAGELWVVRGQTQEGYRGAGVCISSAPRCNYSEELFLNDERLRHVDSISSVVPGSWFFDYGGDAIYIADDPRGQNVEVSVVEGGIIGDADYVTVRGLTFEKFANPAQRGVIMSDRVAASTTYGRGWKIENNVVRLNHGAGIRASDEAQVRFNRILANGQLGVTSVGGQGTIFEGNEIAYNNASGYDFAWEGGGSKFVETRGLVVRGNHVHHNIGPGLWTDISNIDTLYEENLVENNVSTGIFHEISYSAIIRNNKVFNNALEAGRHRYAFVFGAGILVYSSPDVEVYGNTVAGNWNGIAGLMHDRGSGLYGRWELTNLYVHDNDVEMSYHSDGVGPQGERGVWGLSGVVQDGGQTFVFDSASNNRFESNHYLVSDLKAPHFGWKNLGNSFEAWTGKYRQDAGATIALGGASSTLAER